MAASRFCKCPPETRSCMWTHTTFYPAAGLWPARVSMVGLAPFLCSLLSSKQPGVSLKTSGFALGGFWPWGVGGLGEGASLHEHVMCDAQLLIVKPLAAACFPCLVKNNSARCCRTSAESLQNFCARCRFFSHYLAAGSDCQRVIS